MQNHHFLAVNAVSWSAHEDKDIALSRLDKTNGFSDVVLGRTLYKIHQPKKDYGISFWVPVNVPFSIIFDDNNQITGEGLTSETILIMDEKRNITEVENL